MTEIDASDSELRIGGATHRMPGTVQEFRAIGDVVVVLLDRSDDAVTEKNNVLGVDLEGNLLWNAERAPPDGEYDWFAGIYERGGELWAYNLSGIEYRIDISDGSIVDERPSK